MKKIYGLLVFVFVLGMITSCTFNPKNTVVDSKKITTLALQELPKDTVLVSYTEDSVYIFNMDNEVVVQTQAVGPNHAVVHILFIMGIFITVFVLVAIISIIHST
jgi:hypothetical protein